MHFIESCFELSFWIKAKTGIGKLTPFTSRRNTATYQVNLKVFSHAGEKSSSVWRDVRFKVKRRRWDFFNYNILSISDSHFLTQVLIPSNKENWRIKEELLLSLPSLLLLVSSAELFPSFLTCPSSSLPELMLCFTCKRATVNCFEFCIFNIKFSIFSCYCLVRYILKQSSMRGLIRFLCLNLGLRGKACWSVFAVVLLGRYNSCLKSCVHCWVESTWSLSLFNWFELLECILNRNWRISDASWNCFLLLQFHCLLSRFTSLIRYLLFLQIFF